jgi:hypothetical protein
LLLQNCTEKAYVQGISRFLQPKSNVITSKVF